MSAASETEARSPASQGADDLFDEEENDVHTASQPLRFGSRQRAADSDSDANDNDEEGRGRPDHEDDIDDGAAAEKEALEYFEDGEAPEAPTVQEQTAWMALPQVPVRRTKETVLARLPNFVRYSDQPFDPETWNEQEEESQLGHDQEIGDKDARSVLRTMSTVRWRWRPVGSSKTPESNARIVRWSDGTESLQLGTEFLDVTPHTEPNVHGVPLTYLYVPHPYEGLLEAECAVRKSLTFKPSLHSETHAKIASAIRHQRSARVVATSETFGALDPEKEKERIERQLKESEKRKHRERMRKLRESTDYDGDLDLGMRRHGTRRRLNRHHVTDWSGDEDDDVGGAVNDYDDDDGFIVNDEDEEGDDAMEEEAADASEDDVERADRDIEEHERKRREEHQ
ncbi:Paf1 complex component [Malassezia pachydermatis]|uniref:Rna polymerase-associated protein leo1 n=1 Tax=Malassezia pachydermatis TaxID=77020 RepID=A0A0M8MSX6_9BASI|nr:hypothetical protein Malapachy_0597 [Malassezia pachydermatis]KOS12981.1 hypothetical protein Malapachy_0597 [Malassezia pachydermatis]